jgi:hypothetical protein
MITISIYKQATGKPVSGARIAVFSNGLPGGRIGEGRTDNQGQIHFNHSPMNGKVIVNGRTEYTGRVEGNKVLYI